MAERDYTSGRQRRGYGLALQRFDRFSVEMNGEGAAGWPDGRMREAHGLSVLRRARAPARDEARLPMKWAVQWPIAYRRGIHWHSAREFAGTRLAWDGGAGNLSAA